MTVPIELLDDDTVDRYLRRIGVERSRHEVHTDLATLGELMLAHLIHVPFENLDVFHRRPVRTDIDWSVTKIVDRGRGGWCFELNGAFGSLLASLGFDVRRLGAAVLLDGPNSTLDHLCCEVTIDEPHLVDVGFGDSFLRPLALNTHDAQDGGNGTYQLLPSPIGTTLTRHVDGIPEAHYRFKRVAHRLSDFAPASNQLASDPESHFRRSLVVTRLLDADGRRVTLSRDRLVVRGPHGTEISGDSVSSEAWWPILKEWFGMQRPSDLGPIH